MTTRKPVNLQFFEDMADLNKFTMLALEAYGVTLNALAQAGIATGDPEQAALVDRVVIRMLRYKADKAAELVMGGPEFLAALDEEIEKLWPPLQAGLDAELAEAVEMRDKWRAEKRNKMN